MRALLAAAIVAAGLFSGAASEAEPRTLAFDQTTSELGVSFLINGDVRRGFFRAFAGEATFDPDDLSTAALTIVFDMDSIDVGDRFGNYIIRTSDWLGVDDHPVARYELIRLEPIGGARHRAYGELEMRGKRHEIVGDIDLDIGEVAATAGGEAFFERSLYGIGVGFTALFVEVGDKIAVEFELTATPQ